MLLLQHTPWYVHFQNYCVLSQFSYSHTSTKIYSLSKHMSSRQNVCLWIVDVFTHTAGAVRTSIISRRGCNAARTSQLVLLQWESMQLFFYSDACMHACMHIHHYSVTYIVNVLAMSSSLLHYDLFWLKWWKIAKSGASEIDADCWLSCASYSLYEGCHYYFSLFTQQASYRVPYLISFSGTFSQVDNCYVIL